MAVTPDKSPSKELVKKGDKPKRSPFAVTNSNCKICKLTPQHRRQLEQMVAMGMTNAEVMRHWNEILEGDYGPDYLNEQNMSTHVRRHLNAQQTAIRRIVERRVQQFADEVGDHEKILLTKEAALEAVIVTGVRNIASGTTFVEPRELVNAIALQANLESETGTVATDELWRQFLAFQDAVKIIVTPEQREQIATQFEKNLQMTTPKELTAVATTTRIEAIEVTEEVIEPIETEGDTEKDV